VTAPAGAGRCLAAVGSVHRALASVPPSQLVDDDPRPDEGESYYELTEEVEHGHARAFASAYLLELLVFEVGVRAASRNPRLLAHGA
jgi:hypothetical protein